MQLILLPWLLAAALLATNTGAAPATPLLVATGNPELSAVASKYYLNCLIWAQNQGLDPRACEAIRIHIDGVGLDDPDDEDGDDQAEAEALPPIPLYGIPPSRPPFGGEKTTPSPPKLRRARSPYPGDAGDEYQPIPIIIVTPPTPPHTPPPPPPPNSPDPHYERPKPPPRPDSPERPPSPPTEWPADS